MKLKVNTQKIKSFFINNKNSFIFLGLFLVVYLFLMFMLSPTGFIFINVVFGFVWVFTMYDVKPILSISSAVIIVVGFITYVSNLEEVSKKYSNLREVKEIKLTQDGFAIKYSLKDGYKYRTVSEIPKCKNKMYLANETINYRLFGAEIIGTYENELVCEKDLKWL